MGATAAAPSEGLAEHTHDMCTHLNAYMHTGMYTVCMYVCMIILQGFFLDFRKKSFFLQFFNEKFYWGSFLRFFSFVVMCSRNSLVGGWQFLDGLWNNTMLAGLLPHQCMLRNTLAGSKNVVSMCRDDTV